MTSGAELPVCYFDCTDIIGYATRSLRVSGIQRVQLNLISYIAQAHGSRLVRCVFQHPGRGDMFELDPSILLADDEFDAEMLMRRIGIFRSRIFPSKAKVRRFLQPYSDRKLTRTLMKCDVMLSALFFPQRLARMGLRRPNAVELAVKPAPLQRITALPADACLVYLGATWMFPRVTAFGRAHAERGGDVVQMVYDLIPQSHPEFVPRSLSASFNSWLDEIVQYTRCYVCISQWTAADLRRVVGAREGVDIAVVKLAHEFHGYQRFERVSAESSTTVAAAELPFVLCVGTLESRKNGLALLRAWQRLIAKLGDRLPRLVFAGKHGWRFDDFETLLDRDPELARRVHIVDSPTDQDLAYLYQRCLFATFPSLCEGWGLPVGEAAWFGKYTLSSNATSLPEVCGSLIDYFDPTDNDALVAGLERAFVERDYLQRKEAAIAQSPMRRWVDVANDIVETIVRLRANRQAHTEPLVRAAG